MNLTAYLHLAWKEVRAIRAFWLSIVVLVVLLQWLISAIYYSPTSLALLYTFGLAAPAFFAVGAAGAAFAVEREEGTFDFLRASPITSRQVLASKLGVAIAATASMFVMLWPSTLLFTYPGSPDSLDGMLGLWLMAAVEAIAWGTLFSLLTARPLVAICLALAAASTMMHLLAWSVQGRIHEFEFAPYLAAVPRRGLVVAMVLAADIYLGLRWLHGGLARGEKTKPAVAGGNTEALARSESVESPLIDHLLRKPDRGAMLAHLFWQHGRQSAWLMGLMAGLVLVTIFMMAVSMGIGANERYAVIPMAVFATLMGCCVFLPDQERRRYRFFVEHNIPPRTVWFTRQVAWLATLFVSTFMICLFWVPLVSIGNLWQLAKSATDQDLYWQNYGWISGPISNFIPFVSLPPLALELAGVAVSYAAGQWTSMLVRSGVLAGFFGFLLSGILCVWVLLMSIMQVNFLWSVMPIPLVLLWATWLRAPDWTRENTRWAARGRAAAAVLVPALTLVIAVPIYRVRQVPQVIPGFHPQHFLSQITPEGEATAALYRRASELYVPSNAMQADVRWLQENAKPLALVLEASSRPTCNFGDPATLADRTWLRNQYWLMTLILTSARQFEAEAELDKALDRYFTALRVVSHWADYALMDGATEPLVEVRQIFTGLANWGTKKGQTGERIKTAIGRLQTIDASILHMDDQLKSEYIVARRAVFGDLPAWRALYGSTKENQAMTAHIIWGKLMPWERLRGERTLNFITATSLGRLQNVRDALTKGIGSIEYLARLGGWTPADEFQVSNAYGAPQPQSRQKAAWQAATYALPQTGISGTFAAAQVAEFEARRRAAMLLLALEAYRLEHGELPKTLDELVGPYLEALPHDPYSGFDFSYFPAGLPQPAMPLDVAQLNEANQWPPLSEVVPGKPCVWCTGPRLLARELWVPQGESEEALHRPERVVYYESRDYWESFRPLLPYGAWRRGNWFPIPDERE